MITNAGESSENILYNPETVQCHTIKTSNAGPKTDWTSGWGDIGHYIHRYALTGSFVKESWQRQMESPENTFFQISA